MAAFIACLAACGGTPVSAPTPVPGVVPVPAPVPSPLPAPTNSPRIEVFSIDPAVIPADKTSTGYIWLRASAPAGGAVVNLESTDPSLAVVPLSITVPPNGTYANFPIITRAPRGDTTVSVTASIGADRQTRLVNLLVAPVASFVTFTSTTGDPVGQGQSRRFDFVRGVQFGGGFDDGNRIVNFLLFERIGPTERMLSWWNLILAAPAGRILTPGVYKNTRGPAPLATGTTDPLLDFRVDQRSCSKSTGEFEVLEVEYGPPECGYTATIKRLHATFRQRCDDSSAAVTGEVMLLSLPPGRRLTGAC